MFLGQIIKDYRKKNKLSMKDFAELASISKQYVSVLEKNQDPRTGKPIIPSIPVIKSVAQAMKLDFDTVFNMLGDEELVALPTTLTEITNTSAKLDEPRQQIVLATAQKQLAEQNKILKFPDNDTVQEILEPYTVHGTGGAAAGRGYSYTDYEFETFYTDVEPPRHDFATPIHGDSMQPYYNNGDVAYIQLSPYNGTDDYIVDYNGQSFIKQVKRNGDTFILHSYNEAYEDIIITREEVESKHIYFNIIGKVIGSFTPIEK